MLFSFIKIHKILITELQSRHFALNCQVQRPLHHLECLGTDVEDFLWSWDTIRVCRGAENCASQGLGQAGSILPKKSLQIHSEPPYFRYRTERPYCRLLEANYRSTYLRFIFCTYNFISLTSHCVYIALFLLTFPMLLHMCALYTLFNYNKLFLLFTFARAPQVSKTYNVRSLFRALCYLWLSCNNMIFLSYTKTYHVERENQKLSQINNLAQM